MREQDEDSVPAHHARRPMNAFLIFCKRYRSIVRVHHPNLENRAVTKILGDWWFLLDPDEKELYIVLAKEYKDAFFEAYPDFKWYKLPAPPLRNSSRPRETNESPVNPPSSEEHEIESVNVNNNSTKIDFNKKSRDDNIGNEPKSSSMFTPGKLADEAQMGGLSSLIATNTEAQTPNPYYTPPSKFNAISTPNPEPRSHSLTEGTSRKDNDLQNALEETTKVFKEDFNEKGRRYRHANMPGDRYPVPNDPLTNQDVIDQIVDKDYQRNSSDEEKYNRSGRSCKGKRYREFMAVGGLIANKRQKRAYSYKMPEEGYGVNCSSDPGSSRSEDSNSTVTDEPKLGNDMDDMSAENELKIEPIDIPEPDNNANKPRKVFDFDLNGRIRALPALTYETFQERKRDGKRKKKTDDPEPEEPESPPIINSVPRPMIDEGRQMNENKRDAVVGSQKRKPRKISITRFEANSMVSRVESNAREINPEIKIAMEAPTVAHNMEICNQTSHGNVDLFALATLAEVAANTSKLDDSAIVHTMTAEASEGNASMV